MKTVLTVICAGMLLTNLSGLYSVPSDPISEPLDLGTVDSFNPDPNADLHAIEFQTDGRILIGGNFTTVGGSPASRVARLNADGSLDTSFTANVSGGTVWTIKILSNGQILIAGGFNSVNGNTVHGMARLNADGTSDTSFVDSITGTTSQVLDLLPRSGGKILIAGRNLVFGPSPGTNMYGLALLNADGSLDQNMAAYPAFNLMSTMAEQPDGKVVIGGNGFLRRLNSDLTVDTSFDPGISGPIANGAVSALTIQPDGNILVGGLFTMLGGGGTGNTARNNIGRILPDGTLDASFNPGANSEVWEFAVASDNTILVCGAFNILGGIPRVAFGRLFPDGSVDGWDPGSNGVVTSVEIQSDLKIMVGGSFNTLGGGGSGNTTRRFIGRFEYSPPGPQASPTPTVSPTATPTPTPTVTPTPTPTPGEEIFGGARYAFRKRKPIRGVLMTLDGPGGSRTTFTDNSGRYSFTGVQPGQYTVTASHPNYLFLDNPRAVTVPQVFWGTYFIGYHPN